MMHHADLVRLALQLRGDVRNGDAAAILDKQLQHYPDDFKVAIYAGDIRLALRAAARRRDPAGEQRRERSPLGILTLAIAHRIFRGGSK